MRKRNKITKPIKFYTYPSCTSCRKTKEWLNEHGINYEERHLFKNPPTVEELMDIIKITENGLEDILSTRGQVFKDLNVDIDNLKVSEVLKLLTSEPGLLRRPIITVGERLIIGYNKPLLESYLA